MILIKSVQPLVSSKKYGDRVDVLVNGGKISAIGSFPNKQADEVIDGQGAYISPGFIDIDTTSDHYLTVFSNRNQEDFLMQGVTTILGGQCGASLGPLFSGNLDSIRKWADTGSINVNWHSIKELLTLLDKKPLGVNFGTLTGHSTIRRAMTSGILRDLTVEEIYIFNHLLEDTLTEGSFGMSTGLGYVYGRGASFKELKIFADTLKKYGTVYSTHLRRSGKELEVSLAETKRLFEETGVEILITHLAPLKGSEKEFTKAIEEIDAFPENAGFHFSMHPFDTSTVPLYSFLPNWAQGSMEDMQKNVLNPHNEERLLESFPNFNGKDIVVAQTLTDDVLVGKNLQEIMKMYSLSNMKKAMLKLMTTTRLRTVVHNRNLNLKLVKEAIKSPHSLISSHAPSFGPKKNFIKSERSTSTFTRYLEIVSKNRVDLEDAIKKITYIPAKKFGLQGRGEIKEGNFGDLTLFKNNEIKAVLVNGKIAWQNGSPTGELNGQILRHV